MNLQTYLEVQFKDIDLYESSFHGKNHAVMLQLEKDLYQLEDDSDRINKDYFNNVYKKANEIFDELFNVSDEIYLVTHVRSEIGLSKRRKGRRIVPYLRDPKDKYRINYNKVILDEGEQIEQFSVLLSNKQKLNYYLMIKAICNQDFKELRPRFSDKDSYYPEIFFINKTKNVILNIFDDRGCFVLFNNQNDYNTFVKNYEKSVVEDS